MAQALENIYLRKEGISAPVTTNI